MSTSLNILRAGPGLTLQDYGRPGWLDLGLSRGGAADRLALAEAAALLGQSGPMAAIEMAGSGGVFEATDDMFIALTGAPMQADLDGTKLVWNASHHLPAGSRLTLGAVLAGTYGYLSISGQCETQPCLGAQSAHLAAGIGRPLASGDRIEMTCMATDQIGMKLDAEDRFGGGTIRMVASFHTKLFSKDDQLRFQTTDFRRDPRGNRMGVRLASDGGGFQAEGARNIVSEVILPGDIQVTGDGTPFVLMSECQTIGGYPRIGTVIPCDLPKIAQAAPGTPLRFVFIELEQAIELERNAATMRKGLARSVRPLIRDPRTITDLLSYQLISGVVAGNEE